MAALAKYGVDVDHSCVRAFTKEEVGADRISLPSSDVFIQNAPIILKEKEPQMDGKLLAFRQIFEETEVVRRDALKPQWIRDFQDSRGRYEGRSGYDRSYEAMRSYPYELVRVN